MNMKTIRQNEACVIGNGVYGYSGENLKAFVKGFEVGYRGGVCDLHSALLTIYRPINEGGMSDQDIISVFPIESMFEILKTFPGKLLKTYSGKEIIEKIDEWENNKESSMLTVGDEIMVERLNGAYLPFLITRIEKSLVYAVSKDGSNLMTISKDVYGTYYYRTKKHFTDFTEWFEDEKE